MEPTYTTTEIEQKCGIPRARSKEWIARKYINPSYQKASGRGTKHLFTRNDLYVIVSYQKILELGISREMAGSIVKTFFYDFGDYTSQIERGLCYLVITKVAPSGENPEIHPQLLPKIPKDIPITSEYILAINLENIKENVDQKL
jgi:hypothetical protein